MSYMTSNSMEGRKRNWKIEDNLIQPLNILTYSQCYQSRLMNASFVQKCYQQKVALKGTKKQFMKVWSLFIVRYAKLHFPVEGTWRYMLQEYTIRSNCLNVLNVKQDVLAKETSRDMLKQFTTMLNPLNANFVQFHLDWRAY